MKRENNKKIKKRRRNQKRNLTCRALSMIFAIVLFCSTVLVNTSYVSQASSFDDMVDMVEIEDDSAGVDTYEETEDDFDIDVNFESEESPAEVCSESEELGSGDADFSSVEDMFTDGSSESSGSAPAEEAAQPVSCIVNLKNETIEIKAEAPAGVLPDGTQMIVKAVENNTEDAELTDQYNKLAAKITEQLQSQSKNLDGFLAYNVSFTDADGNPVEPAGKVTYSFTYIEASSPELTDPAASTVTAAMIRTNKETSELELTELKAEEDQLTVETNESRQLTRAAFQAAGADTYTFVWSSTPAADDNENNENNEDNGEVNNEEVNADTNTENTEENGEEAPDQTQIKMIRIIADEVNLRVAPSTEAEVIATVDTDTELPLLETVTGEDETIWYKVSYDEAEAYVRSDMAEVVGTEEQGTENEDANDEAEVQVEDEVTYSRTIDNVVVTATAAKGVLPEDAEFVVTPIKSEDAQYEDIAARLEEKAANEEYSIAGFLAYDIYFQDNDGNKINPEDGKVKISMEYQNAAAPDEVKESDAVQMDVEEEETSQENTEAKELSVSVMHFVEENGEVTSVVDMTKENSAAVETNEAGEVQKAEFETESFSTFTITWKYTPWNSYNTSYKNLSVHLVYLDNGQYEEIPGTANEYEEYINNGEDIELADLANEYKVEGYAYEKALEDNKTTEISNISYNSASQNTYGWFYKSNDSWIHATTNNDYDIYLVYNKLSVWIKDDIMDTGNLILETDEATTNEINDAIKADKEVTYTWLKSTDGGKNYTPVERKRRGNNYNLSEDGKSLNVALDDGALNSEQTSVKYKVNIIIKEDDNNVENIESEVFDNEYWNELQNGSFETPTINSTTSINEQYTNAAYKKAGGVWQSTGRPENKNVNIEIVNTRASFQSAYSWHGTDKAYHGNQFAELNCEAPGALYQDVMTYAGETMNYWLSHRARGAYPNGGDIDGETDTMYLVIMPTSKAMTAASGSELKTQNQLKAYLGLLLPGVDLDAEASGDGKQKSEILYNNDGILISRITSDDQSWHRILETDRYRSTSYLTRFFFMSGHTASGEDTVGNFLDKVGFSQQLPPVTEDEFTLQIKKSFEGLGSTDINAVKNNIKFNITVKNGETPLSNDEIDNLLGTTSASISGSEMTLQSDGTLVYTFANKKIANDATYEITITEADADLDGYSLTTTAQTSTQIGDAAPTVGEDSSVVSIQRGETTAIVSFKNKYEENNYKNINFTKVWDDADNKYKTRPTSLDVTLHATYTVNENGTTQTKTLDLTGKVTPDATTTLPVNNEWKCSWRVPVYHKLDNGTKVKIKYTVTEGENSSAYVYKAITNNGNAINGDGTKYTSQFSDTGLSTSTTSNKAPKKNVISRMSTGLNNLFSGADATATTSNADTSSSNTLGEPAHRKYITYNEATSDYTLNLDVTGAKGSTPGVDVLFVIDTSGSMGYYYNNLLPTVKSLLTGTNGIVDKIFARSGNVNSVAMVSFAGKDETKTTDWYSNSEKGTFKGKVNALKATGGTNWTYAMIKAQEVMSQRKNSSNEKVVIFLSDGKPTYSYSDGRQTGNGSETKDKYYKEAANQVTGSLSDAKIYSVYLTSGTKEGMKKFSDKVNNSELVDGTNLSSALTNILNKVIPTYKNVTITDQLSEYVDFVESAPVITVIKKTASGQISTMTGSEYTASVNKETKTITVQLLNNGSLDDGATYTVSFKVKPSDLANKTYAERGYLDTGDPNTGTTSAGQAGFYSNIDAGTKLQYQIDGTTDPTQTASYSKPVVQVTTHTLTYTKTWNCPDSVTPPTQDVVLHVTYTDGGTKDITLTSAKKYTFHETVPVTRVIQSITEEEVAGYTPSFDINADGTSAVITNNYNKITASSITVNKVWIGNGPKSPITVSLYRSENGGEAKLYKTVELNESEDTSKNWKHTWSNLPTSEGSGNTLTTYTYSVREEKIPANYSSNIVPTHNEDGSITFTITNKYDENCADENYYIANVLQTEQLHIQKTWDDNENTAGLRPTKLNVTVDGADYTLNATDNWSKNVKILKKKAMLTEASESVPEYYQQVGNAYISSVNDGVYVLFKNKLESTSITVTKHWNDGGATGRPGSVGYQLQYKSPNSSNWQDYGEADYITAEDNNGTTDWTTVINNLPAAFEYQVVEVSQNDNYISTVTRNGDTFTITNTLKWSAVKKSADDNVGLSGAEFELKNADGTTLATGVSGTDGVIEWTLKEGTTVDLNHLNGTYTIHETKAPAGYMKNDSGWTVTFENGLLTQLNNAPATGTAATGVVIELTNQKVYTLPSTGGSGIYWYMIGGMVLMSTAAWILYKNKCKEVLGK